MTNQVSLKLKVQAKLTQISFKKNILTKFVRVGDAELTPSVLILLSRIKTNALDEFKGKIEANFMRTMLSYKV